MTGGIVPFFSMPSLPDRLRMRLVGAYLTAIRWVGNRFSHTTILGNAKCDVSMTSFGDRIVSAYLSIESIGRGTVRPRSVTLWLDKSEEHRNLPSTIERLRSRGLTVRYSQSDLWGPHTKYYPHCVSTNDHDGLSLVTADDDTLYPAYWLSMLIETASQFPEAVVAHRAHEIMVSSGGEILPYASWPRMSRADGPAFRCFATGVSGVLYPVALQSALRSRGEEFMRAAPTADDVWVNATATRSGIPAVVAGKASKIFPTIRVTRKSPMLMNSNVLGGENDAQIRRTYTLAEIEKISRETGGDVF